MSNKQKLKVLTDFSQLGEVKEDIDLYFDAGSYNLQIEIAIGNALVSRFENISHMIILSYDGKKLVIEFLDPLAKYKKEVVDFLNNLIKEFTHDKQ